MDGKLVDRDQATVSILAHVIHYGSSIFEGIRAYNTPDGPAVFRLPEHLERLYNSCRIYRMEIPFTRKQLLDATLETLRLHDVRHWVSPYVRPVVYRGFRHLGVDPTGCPINVAIAVFDMAHYLGEDAKRNGVRVCVSSWNRIAPNTLPAMAKASANYMNSQLIKMEANAILKPDPAKKEKVEGISLDVSGHVSEGTGENIFLVRDGALVTPSFGSSILPGVTRNTVIALAQEMGIKVIEEQIPREALYIANEVFFSGTAVEIVAVRSIDGIEVGDPALSPEERWPVTTKIRQRFFAIVTGKEPDRRGWLTYVDKKVKPAVKEKEFVTT
jgi:branched-chain amino acid aminotransferase